MQHKPHGRSGTNLQQLAADITPFDDGFLGQIFCPEICVLQNGFYGKVATLEPRVSPYGRSCTASWHRTAPPVKLQTVITSLSLLHVTMNVLHARMLRVHITSTN